MLNFNAAVAMQELGIENLNTSHVKLQLITLTSSSSILFDLNTSHVKLQQTGTKMTVHRCQVFKYISC